eukprot:SAG31_NODE_4398_length_3239_cov_6.414380_1_plen_142_part_00
MANPSSPSKSFAVRTSVTVPTPAPMEAEHQPMKRGVGGAAKVTAVCAPSWRNASQCSAKAPCRTAHAEGEKLHQHPARQRVCAGKPTCSARTPIFRLVAAMSLRAVAGHQMRVDGGSIRAHCGATHSDDPGAPRLANQSIV